MLVVLSTYAVARLFVMPAGRWYLRRRMNRVIDDVNARLRLQLPTFQLTRRDVLIDRLTYDPEVMAAVRKAAAERGVSREEVAAEVQRYAREMVPAFNAILYFRVGYTLARRFLRALYHVRLGWAHEEALAAFPPDTTVVFFINHRSNMDYLLVTYLASRSAALSYGAGEWARIWPFRSALRLAGAYILRRDASDPVYRAVLRRYVQMATAAGVPHAIFGEGQLSRNGMVNAPKLGLLGYICGGFDPDKTSDILFIPVGTNFDAVIEERILIENTAKDFRGSSAFFVLASTSRFAIQQIWRKLAGRYRGFGVASASFGQPLSLRAWSEKRDIDLRKCDRAVFFEAVEDLARDLTERTLEVIPVLAVPLIAMTLLESREPSPVTELKRRTHEEMEALRELGAHIGFEEGREDDALNAGMAMLTERRLVVIDEQGRVAPRDEERALLNYYANSIVQLRARLMEVSKN
ncbi:MAG: glycerol-3-phosphate acyltransferase [Alphaproteobacteria bacterium]|nr:glycerol-3-phosphate acyltransferase [Alphaproteobacteria bacterium]